MSDRFSNRHGFSSRAESLDIEGLWHERALPQVRKRSLCVHSVSGFGDDFARSEQIMLTVREEPRAALVFPAAAFTATAGVAAPPAEGTFCSASCGGPEEVPTATAAVPVACAAGVS